MSNTPQKASKERYHLVPRTLIFIFQNDQVLLIKGAPHKKIWANLFNGLGGHIEQKENLLQSARRELKEETGLENTNLRLCGAITIDTGQTPGIGLFVFRGDYSEGSLKVSAEGSLHWIPIKELSNYPLVEDLNILLPKVYNQNPGDPLIIGHYSYNTDGNLQVEFV